MPGPPCVSITSRYCLVTALMAVISFVVRVLPRTQKIKTQVTGK